MNEVYAMIAVIVGLYLLSRVIFWIGVKLDNLMLRWFK